MLPSASFALTNTLGSWSGDFHAPASLVSIISGVGLIFGSVAGCSIVPLMARKLPLLPLYLSVGLVGAAFTFSLLLLPHVPTTFGLVFMGENFFQAAAIATGTAIIFGLIGPGYAFCSPSLLAAASSRHERWKSMHRAWSGVGLHDEKKVPRGRVCGTRDDVIQKIDEPEPGITGGHIGTASLST